MPNKPLHRYALAVAVCTLFLIVAGATVTSKDAGLSVPDWPLSYGKLMPRMEGGIFYEHGHRMIATLVGMLTIVLAFWLWGVERPGWLGRMGFIALGLVCAQGLLGGLTVIFLLPPAVSSMHACLAQLFFSTICSIALFTSPHWKRGPQLVPDTGSVPTRVLALAVPVLVFVQLALGAIARHKALGYIWHIANASIVTGVILWASVRILLHYSQHPALRRAALALLGITFAQVFLGVAAYMSRIATADAVQPMPIMVTFTVLHVAVGALTLATSVLMAIEVRRNVLAPERIDAIASHLAVAR